jgi:hypothetical protein
MGKRSSTLLRTFRTKLTNLEGIQQKYENLFGAGDLALDDIYQGYSGLYLDLFTEFESFLENLFIGLLTGDYYSSDPAVKRKVRLLPSSMSVEVLYSGRSYLDWIPYPDYTIARARRFFNDGLPFTKVTQPEKDRLNNLYIIRNAIAHKSPKAQLEFQALISYLTLLPHERTPAGYLRSIPNPATGDTQFQIAAQDLEGICKLLCK